MMDGWTKVGSQNTTCCSAENFLKATSILIEKPHVINRSVCGASMLGQEKKFRSTRSINDIFESLAQLRTQSMKKWNGSEFNTCFVDELSSELLKKCFHSDVSTTNALGNEWKIKIRLVLPKNEQKLKKMLELVVSGEKTGATLFFPLMTMCDGDTVVSSDQAFCLLHSVSNQEACDDRMGTITLYSEKSKLHPHHSEKWLSNILLPKLVKWCEEDDLHVGAASLRLVPLERYNQVYQELKEKYGKKWVEIWPERTDPLKFVYEEVAIASYLLVLFEEERKIKNLKNRQSFVDLGCGNGFLVYVLASEGHPGKGIDVRKRAIWDMYGPEVILEESSIVPSDETVFKDFDWLIGNHSDELTPWIPVMAARSGYSCNYFVLPCCAHDFNGKFSERRPGCSLYQAYLNYVKEVGVKCGFNVQQDVLRIPSTKRTCFVGCERMYAEEDEKTVDTERGLFINERCARKQRGAEKQKDTVEDAKSCSISSKQRQSNGSGEIGYCDSAQSETSCTVLENKCEKCDGETSERKRKCSDNSQNDSFEKPDKQKCVETIERTDCDNLGAGSWAQNFKPREQIEQVRNCTKVSRDLQDRIVNEVFQAILLDKDASTVLTTDCRNWNRGGSIALSDVAKMFDKSCLSQLKNECGGLQTLLRNKHQVFIVVGGKVHLRFEDGSLPSRKDKKDKKNTPSIKTKLCWFFDNHPNGCPKERKDCLFAHGEDDLKKII